MIGIGSRRCCSSHVRCHRAQLAPSSPSRRWHSSYLSRPVDNDQSLKAVSRQPSVVARLVAVRWASSACESMVADLASSSVGPLGHDAKVALARAAANKPVQVQAWPESSDEASGSALAPESVADAADKAPGLVEASADLTEPFILPGAEQTSAESMADVPERIGYLKEVCNLDFGWGPSSVTEWMVEHIHIVGGLSWSTSSILVAVLVRVLLFPLVGRASDMSARSAGARPLLQETQAKMRQAQQANNKVRQAEAQAEMEAIRKEYGIKFLPMLLPVLIQVPAGFAGFRVLRNMADLPVPALAQEQWLWIHDLTTGDPYFILPIFNAVSLHFTIKMSSGAKAGGANPALQSTMAQVFPIFSLIFLYFQPACLQLYFTTSTLLAFASNRLLAHERFRSWWGLAPRDSSAATPPQSLRSPSRPAAAPPPSVSPPAPAASIAKSKSAATVRAQDGRIGPAGLRLYRGARVSHPPTPLPSHPPPTDTAATVDDISTPAAPSQKISLIDRAIDAFKTRKKSVFEELSRVLGVNHEQKRIKAEQRNRQAQRDRYIEYMKMREGR